MFYVFRAVAGIGSGGVTNIAMIIVSDVVTLEERGKYQGFIGFSTGVGNVIGPFLAAAFISTTTWRAFFWLLAPLAILCAGITFFLLPSKPPQTTIRDGAKNIDYWGVLTMSIGVIFLLIPISGVSSCTYRALLCLSKEADQTGSQFRVVHTFPGIVPWSSACLLLGRSRFLLSCWWSGKSLDYR